MQKFTICVRVDEPAEVAAIQAWFTRWKEQLTYISDNQGCGCCVNIWDVQGPQEAFDALPPELYSGPQPNDVRHRSRNHIKLIILALLVLCFVFAKVMTYRS